MASVKTDRRSVRSRLNRPAHWALFTVFLVLLSGPAWGAVTVHGTPAAAATGSAGAISLTISPFTVPSNGTTYSGTFECFNPALVVAISVLRDAGVAPAIGSVVWDPDPPGGSTYALQLQDATAGNTDQTGDSRRKRTEMWLMTTAVPSAVNPIPSGSGRILISWTTIAEVVAGAVMTCAVDQASPRRGGTFGDAGGTADASAEVGVSSSSTGLAIDVLAVEGNISVSSALPARTNRWNLATGGTSLDLRGYASTYPTTASFTNLQYSLSANDHWALAALTLRPSGVTAEGVSEFAAAPAGGGVELSWQAGWDANTLGYQIWRERGGERTLVTPQLIVGSFLAHGRERLAAGHSYAWRDNGGRPGDGYVLERLGLDGRAEVVATARSGGREARRALRPSSPTLGAVAAATASPARVRPYLPGSTPGGNGPESEATQFWLAGQPALKIGVRETGWYRIPALDLLAAGLPVEVSSLNRLRLFADGQEVALRVTLGRSGQRLDADSSIEFWGEGLDSPHADTRVYWLVLDGRLGRRIADPGASNVGGGEVGVFSSRVEVRERLVYVPAVRNGEEENFFGRLLAVGREVTYALATPHLATTPSSRGTLELTLQGLSEGEHHIAVSLNGSSLGTVSGSGNAPMTASFVVSSELLRLVGDNELVLTNWSGKNVVSVVNRVALSYPRLTRASGNELYIPSVTWPAGGLLLGGFERPGARVFDVTEPRNPVELATRAVNDGNTHGVVVEGRRVGLRTHTALYAVVPDQLRRPAFLRMNRPSQLHAEANAADWVVLAGKGLAGALAPLVELRSRQGLRTMVVDVEDVFDEFSGGSANPWALRRFFQRAATTWQGKPAYVVLAGDGSYDPRDYLGQGGNLVPVAAVDTELFETASDDWFVDFNGDGVGELAIGRLPASSKGELAVMVDKILRYEAGQRQPLRALLVADDPLLEAFSEVNQLLVRHLPPGTTTDHIDVERAGVAPARARLLAELARGWDLVHYSGHGTVDRWRHGVLQASDAPSLPVTGPWVLTMANCLSGIFQEPLLAGLGEELLRAPGGPALVWASTGSTRALAQEELLAKFFASGFALQDGRVGGAVRAAKGAVSNHDVRLTWVLLGDPAMRLR